MLVEHPKNVSNKLLGTNETHIRVAYVSHIVGRRAVVDFVVFAREREEPIFDDGIWYSKDVFLEWWKEYFKDAPEGVL
jgi:hypothetical protein